MRTKAEIGSPSWFGRIPNGWELLPLKRLFRFSKGLSIKKSDLTETGIPVISYGQIHSKDNKTVSQDSSLLRFVPEEKASGHPDSETTPEGFIFADTSEDLEGCGNCVRIEGQSGIYGGYHTIVLTPTTRVRTRYFAYLFTTDAWRWQIRRGLVDVKLFSVSQQTLKETYIVLPPANEQQQIVSYLDERCAAIDADIAKRRELIAKLEEYRKSVISKAVTKGLDPDAPMKDSGVEWIGEIPKDWRIVPLKYLADVAGGATPAKSVTRYWEGSIPWVSSAEVKSERLNDTSLHITEEAINSCSTQLCPEGSVVMVVRSGILKHRLPVAILDRPMTINQDIKAFRFRIEGMGPFFLRFVQGLNDQLLIALAHGQATVDNLDIERLLSLPVVIPNGKDLKSVTFYLDERCAAIDRIIGKQKQLIGKLEEYRKSIIYNAVTGKTDISEGR